MAWVYLVVASIFEICWMYSLKLLEFTKLLKLGIVKIFSSQEGLLLLMPALGYVIFGIGNIIFFSKAMKYIPASLAFIVWTSIVFIGSKVIDTIYLKEPFSTSSLICVLLILIGVFGLKIIN